MTKLYEAADIPMTLTPWGEHKPFAIAKDGIVTVISASDPTEGQHMGLRTILFEDLPGKTKETENDLLTFIAITKEWAWVERFVTGFALFPFTEKAAKKALGENISRRLNGALGLIERHSDPTEWTPATEQVMNQYVKEHDWILDKLADRILQNMLLGGIIK